MAASFLIRKRCGGFFGGSSCGLERTSVLRVVLGAGPGREGAGAPHSSSRQGGPRRVQRRAGTCPSPGAHLGAFGSGCAKSAGKAVRSEGGIGLSTVLSRAGSAATDGRGCAATHGDGAGFAASPGTGWVAWLETSAAPLVQLEPARHASLSWFLYLCLISPVYSPFLCLFSHVASSVSRSTPRASSSCGHPRVLRCPFFLTLSVAFQTFPGNPTRGR